MSILKQEIKYSKFYDYLVSIGCDAEDIIKSLGFMDLSYDDYLNLKEIKHYLESIELTTQTIEIDLYLKKLQLSNLLPGFVDAFINDNSIADTNPYNSNNYGLLSQKLFKHLLSHRLPVNQIYTLNNNIDLRKNFTIIQEIRHQTRKNSLHKEYLNNEQCIKYVRVCCSHHTAKRLFTEVTSNSSSSNKYWEINGKTSGCESNEHTIIIYLKDNIKLIKLLVNLNDKLDKQYLFEISIGNGDYDGRTTKLLTSCVLQSSINSDLEQVLCDKFPSNVIYSYIRIRIRPNRDNTNTSIKIKSFKLFGTRNNSLDNKEISVQDASICWFLDILSTLAIANTQLMPNMLNNLIKISKNALEHIVPLSLAPFNNHKLMTTPVLIKVNDFLRQLIDFPINLNKQDLAQVILLYLQFNLARGHLTEILYALNWILSMY